MKQISNKFQQGTLTILIAGNAFKLEKVGPAFSIFNPCPSLPPVATDDREQFQCLNIVLNDKTEPLFLDSIGVKTSFSFLKRQQMV